LSRFCSVAVQEYIHVYDDAAPKMKDAASSAQTQLEQQRTTVLQEAQSRVQQLEQEVQDYAAGKLETRTAELSKKVEVMLQNMENTRSKNEMEADVLLHFTSYHWSVICTTP